MTQKYDVVTVRLWNGEKDGRMKKWRVGESEDILASYLIIKYCFENDLLWIEKCVLWVHVGSISQYFWVRLLLKKAHRYTNIYVSCAYVVHSVEHSSVIQRMQDSNIKSTRKMSDCFLKTWRAERTLGMKCILANKLTYRNSKYFCIKTVKYSVFFFNYGKL